MVSPQPSAPPNPPLSYADRAKKAQNLRPNNPLRTSPQNVSTASAIAASTSSAASGPSTVASTSTSVAKSSPPISTDVTPASSVLSSAKPASRPSSPLQSASNVNGDVKQSAVDSSGSVIQTETVSAPKPAPVPAVNVWNRRKEEQMARVRSNQGSAVSGSIQKSSSSPTSSQPQASSLRGVESDMPSAVASSSNSSALQNVTNQRSPAATMPNGSKDNHTREDADASVLRPRALAADDAETWPEVGKAVTQANNGHAQADRKGREETEQSGRVHERDASREGSQGQGTSRKSEKTKWVPIPPAELQAAADAARSQNARHRSHHPHHHPQGHARHPHADSSSASASGSQVQSRTHSVSGVRQSVSNSHAGSVSHSQTQSRTGSTHSSPPVPSARDGRRLPEDGATGQRSVMGTGPSSVASRSISMRSSQTGSPQTHYPMLPANEFIPGNIMAYRNLPSNPAHPAPRGSGSAEQDLGSMNGVIHPYYASPPVAPPLSAQRSYHSPHSSGSPVQSPYSLPMSAPVPTMYNHLGAQGPMHPPYGAAPPYPVYPPYNYPYQPYMYWHTGPVSHSPVGPEGLPPPTTLAQPPPPGESEVVIEYRDVAFVLPPPATYTRPEDQLGGTQEDGQKDEGVKELERGRRARELSFGSIGMVGTENQDEARVTSPHGDALGLDVGGTQADEHADVAKNDEAGEKPTAPFAIGVSPGETGPTRIRSRTRTQSKGRTLVVGDAAVAVVRSTSEQSETSVQAGGMVADATAVVGKEKDVEELEASMKVIDLTDSGETKWEFGTTRHPEAEGMAHEENAGYAAPIQHSIPTFDVVAEQTEPPVPPIHTGAAYHAQPPRPPPIMTTTNGFSSAHSPMNSAPSALPPLSASDPGSADEWKVKDYGYGFGRKSGGYPLPIPGDERNRREWYQDRESYGRPRRGSVGGGYSHDRGGYERGGFSGRRGRGMGGGFGGRGVYHPRTHSRGGSTYQAAQTRQPPFVAPPPPQPPLPPQSLSADLNGYYVPSQPPLSTYFTPAYEAYPTAYPPYPPQQSTLATPPFPVPLTSLTFPLEMTRYYLLGQLEYYLSPQNMAQDFFLRQRMDSSGWISIPLIASFKRVRQLTMDLQVVKDVLILSSLVEVKEDWVRMHQWEQFVLPNAAKSTVGDVQESDSVPAAGVLTEQHILSKPDSPQGEEGDEGEGEEEEEEDVVFVLGKEADPSWTS